MASVDFSYSNALSSYANMIKEVPTFTIFAIVTLILVIVIAANIETKKASLVFYTMNVLMIGIICFTFGSDILNNLDTIFDWDFHKNIYFFFINTIAALLAISSVYRSKRIENGFKCLTMVLYYLILVNLLFMISVSNFFSNQIMLVLPNTYPMIYVGNILCFILYGLIIIYWATLMKKKKVHHFERRF